MNDKHAATSPRTFALKPDIDSPMGRCYAALTQRDGYTPADALAFLRDVFPDLVTEYLADRQTMAALVAAANAEHADPLAANAAQTRPANADHADPLAANAPATTPEADADAAQMAELVAAANSAR
jgi:hypothetical protein